MTRQQQEAKEQRIKDALVDLARDPRFTVFMEALRDMREGAVQYMTTHTTVKEEREMLAAVGEVRCFDTILASYDAALEYSAPEEQQQAS